MRVSTTMVAAAFAFAMASAVQAKDVLKFAIFTPSAEMNNVEIFIPWAKKVTEESNGALEIQVFADGALGRNPGLQTKLLQDGIADIVWAVPSYTPGVYPDDTVFELPNVVQNSLEGSLAAWRMLEKGELRGYENFYMIGLFAAPANTLHTNFPAREAADFKGKKIRAVGGIATEAINAIGAVPEGMPITQVVEAVSRGVVDGAISHPVALSDFGISRVTNSHFQGRLGSNTLGLFMSKASFERLSPESKAVIEANRGEVLSRAFGHLNDSTAAKFLDEWRRDPNRVVTDLTPEQTAAWEALLQPVIDNWEAADPNNKALLGALRGELEAIRSGQ